MNRLYRSAKRTLRRCVGWSPAKITNDDIGTEASQCAKFARFHQLYREYKNDPDSHVRNFMDIVHSAVEFFNMLPDTLDDECLILKGDDIQQRFMLIKDQIYELPDTPRYYNVLKTEMTFFADFLYNLYMRKHYGCDKLRLSLSTPASTPAPTLTPVSSKEPQDNIQFYTGAFLRRAKKQRHTRKQRRISYRR